MTEQNEQRHGKSSSLIDLVDAAHHENDRTTAEAHLTMDAGHGTISSGWIINTAS